MRRNTTSIFLHGLITAGVISLGVTALGCADGTSPATTTSSSSGPGSGGGGGASGAGGSGGDDGTTSSSTTTSTTTTTTTSGGGGEGGGEGGGGEGGSGEGGSGEGGEGGGGGCGVECPDGLHDVDNNPLTGECGCEYACTVVGTGTTDPIDEDFADDNCDGGDGVVESCIYVSASLGDDANGGTRQAPKRTIAGAIEHAVTNGVPAVCLSGEVYAENVLVASGVSIYGGFDHTDPDFAFRRSADATTTVVAEGTVFYADDIAVDTHIEGMRIEALSTGVPGSSVYGVRLRAGLGRLYVRYNDLQIADAPDGNDGGDGAPPPEAIAPSGNDGDDGFEDDDPAGGSGGPAPVCAEPGGKGGDSGYGSNSPGLPGDPGSGGDAGGAFGAGVSPCGTADDGLAPVTNGSPGTNGSVGGGGQSVGRIDTGAALYVPSTGLSGTNGTNGKGGGGGGGGGGGPHRQWSFDSWCVRDRGGAGGSGGCGGIGGKLGTGGDGGGGSFGVFAAAGRITVSDNEILTGFGGDGGIGGSGGDRQLGGGGGGGGAKDPESTSSSGGVGGSGARGGDGGVGGPGGGGGGGPSICFARASSSQAEYDANSCSTAGAGTGGLGGSNSLGSQGGPGASGTVGFNVTINTL